ncbi:MAG: rhodanese-like domain-containing protein [Opitutaceae bacterium]
MSPRTPFLLRLAATGSCLFGLASFTFSQDRFPDSLPTRPPATATQANAPANKAPANPPTAHAPRSSAAVSGQGQTASSSGKAAAPRFVAVAEIEAKDFGVAASRQLRSDPMHAPTPTQIEGGAVISTEALYAMTQQKDSPFIIFDVLGGERGLPGAKNAQPAGNEGTFSDSTQRDFGNYLQQATQGKRDVALIFYCQNNHCWRSYNAALRAIKLGYTRVYWYRGGIEAWAQADLPTVRRQ